MVNVKDKMKGAIVFGYYVENLTQKICGQWVYTTHNILRTSYDQRSGQCRICMRSV